MTLLLDTHTVRVHSQKGVIRIATDDTIGCV